MQLHVFMCIHQLLITNFEMVLYLYLHFHLIRWIINVTDTNRQVV